MTLRLSVGRSYGGQHSQDLSGIVARVNGLKVYYPATPTDMLATLRYAISSKDPVIVFEPKEYYGKTEITAKIPQEENVLEDTSIKVKGNNATIVTIGPTLYDAIDSNLENDLGLEIISLVSIAPIDYAPIIDSVKKTGKLIIMGESSFSSGIMTDVCAHLQKACFGSLNSPIEILSTDSTIVPPNGAESGYYNLKESLISLLK
jgi:2-oxoisovalerate dehydrogenase E1 component